MPNSHGIPIQQQHGEIDDNVPAYNSRLLAQQLFLSGTNSSYNEVPGQNHWWDTVMTTPQLVDFYYKQTNNNEKVPRKLEDFEIVVGDPGDMGSKSGIKVLHLEDPGQYGRVQVQGHQITTSNVLSIDFDPSIWKGQTVTMDGSDLFLDDVSTPTTVSQSNGAWSIRTQGHSAGGLPTRYGRQLGSMTAILRTRGPFIIRHQGSEVSTRLALQVSRNLHQYFQADTNIIPSSSWDDAIEGSGNVITLILQGNTPASLHSDFPLQPSSSSIAVRDSRGNLRVYGKDGTSVGAAFLSPLKGEQLELVIWGSDEDALARATRLVPMVTGVGQPDFVILGEKAKVKGVDGALAMGFLDHEWKVTPSSVLS